ncbi:TetR/AcrR family transcriptional regulator [Sphingomonas sp. MMS24-J13]|uniref:TetR/AcrR family transcriptional regulator n=1 Tax=Sphingomonas sp. MMS24-J13 TaxID=3238686 RepID=UPI00384B574E
MRSDARTRREALLTAGEQCFREAGFSVPLEQIADRAGVGRGTLYRNFKDRMALALAIFDRQVGEIEKVIDPDLPLDRVLTALVKQSTSGAALFQRIAGDMPLDGEHRAAFNAMRDRILVALQPLADKAHADGTLRPDIDAHGLLIATQMINGTVKLHMNPAEVDAVIAEALDLLMRGFRPA